MGLISRLKGNIYVYIGAALAGLGLVSALIFGAIRYVNSVDTKAFERGQKVAEAAYAQRDNVALEAARKEVQVLTEKVRVQESKAAKDMAAIDKRRQKEIEDAKAVYDRDIAVVRLRDPGPRDGPASAATGGGSTEGKTAGAACERNGAAGAELSNAAARFLFRLANEADEIVLQLRAAQDVIRLYRETVNGD